MLARLLVAKTPQPKPNKPVPTPEPSQAEGDDKADKSKQKAREPVRLTPTFKSRLEVVKSMINSQRKEGERSLSLGDIIMLGMKDWLELAEERYRISHKH